MSRRYPNRQNQDEDEFNELFHGTSSVQIDDVDDELETPIIDINMDEVNHESERMALLITQRLSDFYFADEYIKEHPYIPTKIMMEMTNIRRLLKMLAVNEKAQDSIILGISYNAGKGSLYTSLTALQNSMLNIQKQLNELTKELEDIFQKMQDECDQAFRDKEKEQNSDGTLTVRGSREFINELNNLMKSGKLKLDETKTNTIQLEEDEVEADEALIIGTR